MAKLNGIRTLTAAVLASLTCSPVVGLRSDCASVDYRVLRADSIVVGETTSVDWEVVRPEQHAVTYKFRVTKALKGSLYEAGDVIIRRYEPHVHFRDCVPFPMDDAGPHLVFATKGQNGDVWFDCPESLQDVDIQCIKRIIVVDEDPGTFLDSDEEVDVSTVLSSIGRTFVNYHNGTDPQPNWTSRDTPERGTIIRYLITHSENKSADLSIHALRVLAYLREPASYDVFKRAAASTDEAKICQGAVGLKLLGDERAIPLLIDRLTQFKAQEEERRIRIEQGEDVEPRQRREDGSGGFPGYWDPERELLSAITSFDDPRVTEYLLDALSEDGDRRVVSSLGRHRDPRAVEPLLRLTWVGNYSAADALKSYDDQRIVQQARERIFDHPLAPRLLAGQGDPEVRAFMIRLIQQGHPDGAVWAAATRDPSAKADLVRSLSYYDRDHNHNYMVAYALGRARAFDLIPTLLEDAALGVDTLFKSSELIMGLADYLRGGNDRCRGRESWDCLRDALRETAVREDWSKEELRLAQQLADTLEHHPPFPTYPSSHDPWVPPSDLADMPDPLDTDAVSTYFKRNHERCRDVLRNGSAGDRLKVIQAMRRSKANVLDGELAVSLLTDPDQMLRGRVSFALSDGTLTLTVGEIEQWAITGDSQTTRSALQYISRHPKPEYVPIVTKVLHGSRHLFDKQLYEAIIETNATGCADLLRAYLENEHFALRVNAAITLVHLGDESGAAALAELQPRLRSCSQCIGGDYLEVAVAQLK